MPPGLLWKKTIAKIFFFFFLFYAYRVFSRYPAATTGQPVPFVLMDMRRKKKTDACRREKRSCISPPPHFILKKRGRIIFERGKKKMSSRLKVASFSLPTSRISSYGSMLVNRWLWILFKYKKGRMTCMYLKMRICSSPSDDDTPHSCNTIWKRLGVIKESLCLNWNFLFFLCGSVILIFYKK